MAGEHWILVIEDDPEMRDEVLLPGLRSRGFKNVMGVGSAIETYRSVLTRNFALFVLDVGLPDESGFTVAKHLRAATGAGIVMLSGRWRARTDRVHGLDEGADAYLTKPVDIELLAATMRSLLRRNAQSPAQPAVAAPAPRPSGWHLDMDGWDLVSPSGARIRLTLAERLLIDQLAANVGSPVSRDAIISRLTQNIHDFDPHRLEMLVHRLRRKILAGTKESLPLTTVRGLGYVLTSR